MNELEDVIGLAIERLPSREEMINILAHHDAKAGANGHYTMTVARCEVDDVWVGIHSPNYAGIQSRCAHNHEFFELIYIYRGAFMNEIEGKLYRHDHSNFVMLNPMVRHRPWTESANDLVFNIFITKRATENVLLYLLRNHSVLFNFFLNAVYDPQAGKGFLTFAMNEGLEKAITDLIVEYYKKEPHYEQLVFARILHLFAMMPACQDPQPTAVSRSRENLTLNQLLEYVDLNIAEVTLHSVAAHLHYSPRHIGRLVKQWTGESFSTIVNRRRIQRAVFLLENSSFPSGEIMEMVGFRDPGYFYKLFYKYRGMPYSQYKRKGAGELCDERALTL